ncbi:hypothetical protein OG21DRAFT_1597219 [Imleria badia]|nr:hypothetical protein OG21DRAFT_1597219 [Imleria badia]
MPEKPKPTRKRNRKRKRRVVSDSSSSEEDSSSSSSSTSTPKKTVTIPVWQPKTSENADTDESSSSSEESRDDSDPGEEDLHISAPSSRPGHPAPPRDSPSPQPNDIPPFVPQNAPESEQALKEKFRKFWMASIAEGFKDDLEEIRKEPNLGPSRLALLIESLASGADVFSSSSAGGCVNEMEVVSDQLP